MAVGFNAAQGIKLDLLTGLGGADVCRSSSLLTPPLANPDWITDFAIGLNKLDGPVAVVSFQVANLGAVNVLTEQAVVVELSAATFLPQKAATDALIEVTGYSGDLRSLAVI